VGNNAACTRLNERAGLLPATHPDFLNHFLVYFGGLIVSKQIRGPRRDVYHDSTSDKDDV
jgi:hypothetical protein